MAVPAASAESPRAYVGVFAFQKQTGKTVYAQAHMDFHGNNLILTFHTATQPFAEMQRYFQENGYPPLQINDQALPEEVENYACFYLQKPTSQEPRLVDQYAPQVQRVFINLHLLSNGLDSRISSIHLALIDRIGQVCRNTFPNFRAHESAYNVHNGFCHCRADAYLLSEHSNDGAIKIHPK